MTTTLKKHETSPAQKLNHEGSANETTVSPQIVGNLTGGALRYDGWPNVNGTVNFGFNWGLINAQSHVYVSASEIDNGGNRFNGSASYTVQNIVVKNGRVEFRVAINWGSPIRISTDILVINP